MQEGKTEDEAVADFGNLDDLAREILSAYKIDDKYTHDKSRDIIDNVVDIMTQGIDSAVTYFYAAFQQPQRRSRNPAGRFDFDRAGRHRPDQNSVLIAGNFGDRSSARDPAELSSRPAKLICSFSNQPDLSLPGRPVNGKLYFPRIRK